MENGRIFGNITKAWIFWTRFSGSPWEAYCRKRVVDAIALWLDNIDVAEFNSGHLTNKAWTISSLTSVGCRKWASLERGVLVFPKSPSCRALRVKSRLTFDLIQSRWRWNFGEFIKLVQVRGTMKKWKKNLERKQSMRMKQGWEWKKEGWMWKRDEKERNVKIKEELERISTEKQSIRKVLRFYQDFENIWCNLTAVTKSR